MPSDQETEKTTRKVTPDELTESLGKLGLQEGDSMMLHASLDNIGVVEGGAAMMLHRLMGILGKGGTLLMPAYTSVTRHSSTHDNYTKSGCWCDGHEDRHLPFIPELQPDKHLDSIAHRLCSWPASRRSRHPAYSFVAVGKHCNELVRDYSLANPLLPIKSFLRQDPSILTIGVGLDRVEAIHLAEQGRLAAKFSLERALTFTSTGRTWVDVTALGCSGGFEKLGAQLGIKDRVESTVGLAKAYRYSAKLLIQRAGALLDKQRTDLLCDNLSCLSCKPIRQ
jgi:aminoglycoside 3-N-acetyltransferase